MAEQGVEDMTPETLKRYLASHREKDYLLIDVRQPAEYAKGHIAGARLIPLMDLVESFSELPADRDLIFYCHGGGRSMAAAAMVAEEGIAHHRLYSLTGGIMAWEGLTVAALPKIRVFDHTRSPSELLMTAMDLEKGAWRFYRELLEKYGSQSFAEDIAHLVKAEAAHARSIYGIWQKGVPDPPSFERLYEDLRGDIMEGGESVANALKRAEAVREDFCLNLMELALQIELSAYDLYRTMAEETVDEKARQAFFSIAQAEKSHMRSIARAIAKCPGIKAG